MLLNYIKIAIRNLRKHKLFATINILGLALGLTIFLFGTMLVRYETTHDVFYANSERIYTVGSYASPKLGIGIRQMNSTMSAAGPVIEAELDDVDAVARTVGYEYLVGTGAESFYQSTWFADEALLEIFDFEFIHGDSGALRDPTAILLTESAAIKYFGSTEIMGEILTLNNQYDFHVSAVIRDLPLNSHFNSLPILEEPMDVIAPFRALQRLDGMEPEGIWDNWSMANMTYVMLPEALDRDWLQAQLDTIFERHVPEETKDIITGFFVSPIRDANLGLWDALGLPLVAIVTLLSFLVLVVACVNYTNLATAQSLGRSREVGMRKTMGAGRRQLLAQFLVESVLIALLAMVIAIGALEIVIPLFNNAAGKAMTLDYLSTLPWMLLTAVLVGLLAGAYPAWLITKTSPIEALREIARKGKSGSRVRAVMIGAQFAISAFMLAVVAIVYVQNQMIQDASYIFPRSEVYNLHRIDSPDLSDRVDTLRRELEALPSVDAVAYSSQVPYQQENSSTYLASTPGDEAGKVMIHQLSMTPEFLDVYDIPLLAGRNLDRGIANDRYTDESETVNVIVNELFLAQFGFESPQAALNQRLYDMDPDDPLREVVIVGVIPMRNIVGFFNPDRPWLYWYLERQLDTASLRVSRGNILDAVEDIERVWKDIVPEYPMQGRFLDDIFNDVYSILRYMNLALAIFAGVALVLALIGLFGLAAFMAAQRTKEIGVRKVHGASSLQIARLLVWQFSKPVMWGLVAALPAAYFASQMYLNFFGDRIDSPVFTLLIAGAAAVVLAWGTVGGHVYRVARANPILALRYE